MSVRSFISNFLTGGNGGLTRKDLDAFRYKFSDMLPYAAYDKTGKFYYMKDNSVGWLFECTPLIFAGGVMDSLSSIFRRPFPQRSVIQTVLYADPYIEDTLENYNKLRVLNDNPIFKAQGERFSDFFRNGAKNGLWQLSRTPVRNFRLYISVKIPVEAAAETNPEGFKNEADKIYKNFISDFVSMMTSSSLGPRPVKPEDFIFLLFRIFNPDTIPVKTEWNEDIPLFKQIINAETLIKRENGAMKIGSMYARCITPKKFPKTIDSFLVNDMIGFFGQGAQSSDDDMNQIKCPFIFSSIFIFENLGPYINMRANQINIQRASGNLASGVAARKEELNWAVDRKEQQGDSFLRAINVLWLFGKNDEELTDNVNSVASMWTNLNVMPQKEMSFILPKLFVSALPLGLYNDDYRDLERDHIVPSVSAAHLTTIQAGCLGLGEPYMFFADRRGQLMAMDILYTGQNKNFLVTGGSGGGKSFFLNYLVNCYRSVGAKVRIIDVGKSYEKMAKMFDGQFIQFAGSDIVLNFFEGMGDIRDDPEDKNAREDYAAKMDMLTGVIATMASKTSDPATSEQITLIETAIRDVYRQYGGQTNIDLIADYLAAIPGDKDRQKKLAEVGYYLSLALRKYCLNGEYGGYFRGKSNVTFNNDLVVVELDGVPEDLRKVVVLAFASKIEDEIYNGDRKTPAIVVLDEAWQTLSDNPAAAKFAEGLYRKIRKYNGGVGIATQSVMDTSRDGKLGQLGVTIRGQSNMHFMLPDNGFVTAKREGVINFTEFEWAMLLDKLPSKSLPKYSEMVVKSDKIVIAARLITDEFTYFVCSSDATDNIFLNHYKNIFMKENPGIAPNEAMVKAIDKAVNICGELGGIGAFKHYVNTRFLPSIKENGGKEL